MEKNICGKRLRTTAMHDMILNYSKCLNIRFRDASHF